MSETTRNLLLVMAGLLVINATVTGLLWLQQRTALHRSSFLVWTFSILSAVVQGQVDSDPWMAFGFGLTTFLVNVMLADVVRRTLELPSHWRLHLKLLAVFSGIALAFTWGEAPFAVRALPMALAAATPLLDVLWRATRKPWRELSLTTRLTLAATALFAFHNLDYPFFRNNPDVAVFGFIPAILAVFAVSITAPSIVLERTALENMRLLQEAQRAVGLRDEFLLMASHELRTPVASLRLTVQGLLAGSLVPTPERLARMLPLLDRQSARIARLVEEMLDVGRLSRPVELTRSPLNLRTLVEDVVRSFSEQAARAGSALEVDASKDILGTWDRTKLEQVLTNLLANALKFGRGRPIHVSVSQEGAQARICVRDEGIGIAADRLPHVFERYERAVSTREYGGLGLGLYIVRSLVEAHGGRVLIESTESVGTRICVELPLSGAPSPVP